MNCVALMRLVQGYKVSLNDQVCQYLPNFPEGITVRTMITEYSRANDPDEKAEYYFSVTAKVLPWVVRVNHVEF